MSDKPAVFTADYYNFEYKKGLKVCRLVFEVPYENAKVVRDVLGDPPLPGEQVQVAIARLSPVAEQSSLSGLSRAPNTEPDSPPPVGPSESGGLGSGARRSFKDMPRSQQAAIKLQDEKFVNWLASEYGNVFPMWEHPDDLLKKALGILSKKDLDTFQHKGERFDALLTSFDMRGYK